MAERAVALQGAQHLVMIADPDGPAYGVYRRLGLETVEQTVELDQNLPGQIA